MVSAVPPSPAASAFRRIQSLAGDWEGTDADGMAAHSEFRLAAAHTVVIETLSAMHMEPMLTLYSLDGASIALVHFCPTNNQPRMRAIPSADPARELTFAFTGAGNLPDDATGHQHRLVLRFDDANHITETWTWRDHGKDTLMVFQFTRKTGPTRKP